MKITNNQRAAYHVIKANPGIGTMLLAEKLKCSHGSVVKFCVNLAALELIIIEKVRNCLRYTASNNAADIPPAEIYIKHPRRQLDTKPTFEIIPTPRGYIHRRVSNTEAT